MVEPLLCMTGIDKAFGSTHALIDVDLEVHAGEVLGLLGENGAGKSTLVKILAGVHGPDSGEMRLDGLPYRPNSPNDARRSGIAVIHQEPSLAPHLTVAENIVLGREDLRAGFFLRDQREMVRACLRRLHRQDIDPDQRVSGLGAAARQIVEVVRALAFDARVLVMDEPTSALGKQDVVQLFELVRRLRAENVGIIYISHFLEEVQQVADRYLVLRDGAAVGHGDAKDATIEDWIEQMSGRRIEDVYPDRSREPVGDVVLSVRELAGAHLPHRVEFDLRRGEIFGIAGLCGSGRTEFLRCLFGLDPVRRGEVKIGVTTDNGAAPRRRLQQGGGMLVEDRQVEGLALDRTLVENLSLSRPMARFGWLSWRAANTEAQGWIDRLGIRTTGPRQVVGDLSGGNQQKVAIARLLHHDVDILCLDEPTRGVDVGSKAEIYRLMVDLVSQGKSILIVSSYLPELLGVCHRIAVMRRGELSSARPTAEWDEQSLLASAVGGAS